jgi:hypothetical protein
LFATLAATGGASQAVMIGSRKNYIVRIVDWNRILEICDGN